MPNNLDLAALIRCLEVMADENEWGKHAVLDDVWLIGNMPESKPWEVAKEALDYIWTCHKRGYDDTAFGHDRISNQEVKP